MSAITPPETRTDPPTSGDAPLGIPSQDPRPAAQVAQTPDEHSEEVKTTLVGGGMVAGAMTGGAIGTAVAGPVGVVVGAAVGAIAGAAGGLAAGAASQEDEASAPPNAP